MKKIDKLKPMLSWGNTRNYDNCMHLEDKKCLLYNCKLCKDVTHRKVEECAFRDKIKFIWGDPDHEKALVKSLELFLGENLEEYIMDAGNKEIKILNPHPRRALGVSPLDKPQNGIVVDKGKATISEPVLKPYISNLA